LFSVAELKEILKLTVLKTLLKNSKEILIKIDKIYINIVKNLINMITEMMMNKLKKAIKMMILIMDLDHKEIRITN
jgi:hypothetical protein